MDKWKDETSQNPHTPCHSSCQLLRDALAANKAMDICRRVDKYFNSEKQWPAGTLEAIYRDAAIVANAATNKGKGGTIGGG